MPRADFYLIAKPRFLDDPLLLVCELATKWHATGRPTSILARDPQQAEAIDEALWACDEDASLPHQIAGMGGVDAVAPILIGAPDVDAPARPLVINLRDDAFDGACER